ncbi:MAG: ROK family protein [Acidobacteria bacterium]|nr:MAG: ROK family protein [Acidobacteriota bacterium]
MNVGFDLGGTKLLMVASGPQGRVVERISTGPGFDGAALEAAIDRFIAAREAPPAAVGVAVPGLVGPGPVVQACDVLPALVGWRPPESLLGRWRFAMINDAAAALAEEYHDAAPGTTGAVVMAGTGIGAALMMRGRPFGGKSGGAGELGSIPIAMADGVRTLDQMASGQALTTRLALDGGALRARAESGDETVRVAIAEAGRALGLGLATLLHVVNPERVAIGGGLTDLPGYLEAALVSAESHTLPELWRACVVQRVREGELVAALGAARFAEGELDPPDD